MQRVHIEFQRVQTWLFAVPRLRAMVGANTVLGETLRIELRKLARKTGRWALGPFASNTAAYPGADSDDPLHGHDNPAADAECGILARDGGHFEALFASGAHEFADEARKLIQERLPGLRFRITIDGVEVPKSQAHLSTELPVLEPCEWTGHGLASAIIEQGNERLAVSLDVESRHQAAKKSEEGKALDLVSLLVSATKLKNLQHPQDLEELVGKGYLALIQADGNSVGSAAAGKSDDEARAQFFHRNRVLLRRALQQAINAHSPDQGQAPLVPLMLGGDDILVVCRAEIVLPFVVTLCKALDELQPEDDSDFKLTLGIGVVIAKPTVPIHRLHAVAEQLASSAKRRFRGLKEAGEQVRSVVDWAVYTTTWVDDPGEVRRRDWLCGTAQNLRILSQRPLDVLGEGLGTLQDLVAGAEKLKNAPRSQLRYLVDQLPRGRALSELAFAELAAEARSALENAGVEKLWKQVSNNGRWMTELLDLVEVAEIARLGESAALTT
ncbi:MAG TPA: hypothetical protein VNP04_28605 [Alphaproteobacteria bacterium]|nr:hypothetical protein [Alphaproteobacteria bacterium]